MSRILHILVGTVNARAGVLLLLAIRLLGQTPGQSELTRAYEALAQKDYDVAIASFRSGLVQQPANGGAHKDLAYTYLAVGDNIAARDEFEKAMRANPNDEKASLEYAFLCYDTKKPIEARRTFDRLRQHGSLASRQTAATAFENIDHPLRDGIARWQDALAHSGNPNDISTYSAHLELAELAEKRDQLPLAAEQYEICRQMKPRVGELLLDLARVWQQLNRVDDARAILLAASRDPDSRTAELASEQLGKRYPYPYEFERALRIDPGNVPLRREFAFLQLAMHRNADAVAQFEQLLAIDPNDQQSKAQLAAMRGFKVRPEAAAAAAAPAAAPAKVDARSMGAKSLQAGYVRDAIKYLRIAHEEDPDDSKVMLQLGWAYNMAKDDGEAIRWFDRARHSDDAAIASEASKAWHNLHDGGQPLLTIWALPIYSSRWNDAFTYGQVKRTIPLPWLGRTQNYFSFYLSARFNGDVRSNLIGSTTPQYLSEKAFIVGGGVASRTWHHLTAWGEVGEAIRYSQTPTNTGIAVPDYRGGVNFAKGFGTLLGATRSGWFTDSTADAIYVHRFDRDWLFYSQNRAGWTFHLPGNIATQALFNANVTRDAKGEAWANTFETGPGLRIHLPWLPPNVYFATDFLRGFYLNGPYVNYSTRTPQQQTRYNDLRISLWYALSK